MGLQWGKIMWIEELLNWIPTKSVPEWLNEFTVTHSFIGFLEILQGPLQKGTERITCEFLLSGLFHYSCLFPTEKFVRNNQNQVSMCSFHIMMQAAENPTETDETHKEDLLARESLKNRFQDSPKVSIKDLVSFPLCSAAHVLASP